MPIFRPDVPRATVAGGESTQGLRDENLRLRICLGYVLQELGRAVEVPRTALESREVPPTTVVSNAVTGALVLAPGRRT